LTSEASSGEEEEEEEEEEDYPSQAQYLCLLIHA
jgi:hypothetical protein